MKSSYTYTQILVSYYIMSQIYDSFYNCAADEICDKCLNLASEFEKSDFNVPYMSLWNCVEAFVNSKGLANGV